MIEDALPLNRFRRSIAFTRIVREDTSDRAKRPPRGTKRHPFHKADSCRLRAGFGPSFSFLDAGEDDSSKFLATSWAWLC